MTLSVSDSSLLGSIQKTRCKVKTFGKVTVYNSVANTATCRTIDYTLTFSFAPPHLLEQNLTNKEKKQRKTLDDGTNFILKFFFVCCRSWLANEFAAQTATSRKSYGLRAVIKRKP